MQSQTVSTVQVFNPLVLETTISDLSSVIWFAHRDAKTAIANGVDLINREHLLAIVRHLAAHEEELDERALDLFSALVRDIVINKVVKPSIGHDWGIVPRD